MSFVRQGVLPCVDLPEDHSSGDHGDGDGQREVIMLDQLRVITHRQGPARADLAGPRVVFCTHQNTPAFVYIIK